jgi:hypothetical protein
MLQHGKDANVRTAARRGPDSTPSSAPIADIAPARPSWSSTTRTARTRATSSSPPQGPRRADGVHDPLQQRRDLRPDAADMLDRLEIPLMTPHNKDSCARRTRSRSDARDGRQHRHLGGRPCAHRAGAADSATEPWEITRPGHVLPAALPRGRRAGPRGHTEPRSTCDGSPA